MQNMSSGTVRLTRGPGFSASSAPVALEVTLDMTSEVMLPDHSVVFVAVAAASGMARIQGLLVMSCPSVGGVPMMQCSRSLRAIVASAKHGSQSVARKRELKNGQLDFRSVFTKKIFCLPCPKNGLKKNFQSCDQRERERETRDEESV